MLYLSRSFVEFGPFAVAEMLGFFQRGLLADSDYVRVDGTDAWLPAPEWAASAQEPTKPKPVKKPKPVAKAKAEPVKKAAPAKKTKKAA